jgi:hypothetical protein
MSLNLQLVPWDVFATVTWRSSKLGTVRSRENDLWAFLKVTLSEKTELKLVHTPVVVRWERGEIGERPHAHLLVSGLEQVTVDWLFRVRTRWFVQFGLSKWRKCSAGHDERADLISYVNKAAFTAADRYEFAKFGGADRLCINDAAWAEMLRLSGVSYVAQHRSA